MNQAAVKQLGALAAPLYRRYWFGSLASVGGVQLVSIGQGWLMYQLTGSPLYLGYLGAAIAIPNIVVSLFGGAIADRFDKRRVLFVTSIGTACLLLLLAALDFTHHVTVTWLLVIAALNSLISGLDMPTRQALFPHLIERSQMPSAVALNSIVWQSTRMVIPAFGGVLIALVDTWLLFLVAALGNMGMVAALLAIRVAVPGQRHQSTASQIMEGFRFIRHSPLFFNLIALSYVAMFFGTSYMQMMPALVEILGAGEKGYGYLMSASGVGSVTGTLIASSLQNHHRLGWILLGGSATSALMIMTLAAICGWANTLGFAAYLAGGAVIAGAFASSFFLISSMTVLQLTVPDALRGRVMGVHGITYSLISLGGLFTGAIAGLTSAPTAIAIAAAIYLAFVLWIGVRRPVLRDIRNA